MAERGTWVYYHGSIEGKHGYMRVVTSHQPYSPLHGEDVVRYVLQYGPKMRQYLENVRPESFTIVDDVFEK